jgi:hypothetical protein
MKCMYPTKSRQGQYKHIHNKLIKENSGVWALRLTWDSGSMVVDLMSDSIYDKYLGQVNHSYVILQGH